MLRCSTIFLLLGTQFAFSDCKQPFPQNVYCNLLWILACRRTYTAFLLAHNCIDNDQFNNSEHWFDTKSFHFGTLQQLRATSRKISVCHFYI